MCALVYPPFFQMVTFWDDWKATLSPARRALRIALNVAIISVGFFAIGAGVTADILQLTQPSSITPTPSG